MKTTAGLVQARLSKSFDNLAENSIRPIAVGRRNYLFCGNDDAAEDAAVIYSFMGCCKASGVDFRTWLIYFPDHVHDYDNDYTKDMAELLPDYLKAAGKLSPHSILTNDWEIIAETLI